MRAFEKKGCDRGVSCRRLGVVLAFFLIASLLLVSSPIFGNADAAHMFIPRRDVAAQDSLIVEVQTGTLNIQSGHALPLTIIVTHQGFPVPEATVELTSSADCCTFRYESNVTDENGQMLVYLTGTTEELIAVDIRAIASHVSHDSSPPFYLKNIAIEPVEPILDRQDMIYVGIGSLLAIAALGATEFGKYGLFKLLFVPLYSRMKKENVLDHFVRGQIYGYIMSHPGEHYNGIKQALKVNNGTLSHHLKTLELQGYLKSQRDGTYKRFYPTGTKVPRNKGIQMSDLQIEIVDAIRQVPGITQKDIAKREGITQQSVSYNLRLLVRWGVLHFSRDGVRKRYFITQES